MPINDFDRGLVEKFGAHDYEYNPAQWERLSQQLPPVKKSGVKRYIWLPLSGIAAAVALFIGVSMFLKKENEQPLITTASKQTINAIQQPAAINTAAPENVPAVNQNTTTAAIVHTSNAVNQPTNNSIKQPVAVQQNTAGNIQPSVVPALPEENTAPLTPQTPVAVTLQPEHLPADPVPAYAPPITEVISKPVRISLADNNTPSRVPASRQIAIDPDDIGYMKTGKKLLLSVAAGYNQGTATSGYALGFNTRKSVGSKVFLESDVAFSANKNANETRSMKASTYDAFIQVAPQSLIANAKAAPSSEVNNMYYIQVTPVVGYQLMDKLSVGAGADVQRLFQDRNKESFVVDDGAIKLVPTMDYGLVGKTEYTLFKSMKAGLQYRYGMNGVLAPEKNYANRSYLQVQLKIGLLGGR